MSSYFLFQPARFKLDGGAMFGIIPKPLWEKGAAPDSMNRIDMAMRMLVIKKKQRLILIDTGIGEHNDSKFTEMFDVRSFNNPLISALKEIGESAQTVTDVVLSHLHFDHVGGLIKFPNATLHLHEDHYKYSFHPTERDTGSFHQSVYSPLIDWYKSEGRAHFISGKEGEILPDLYFKTSTGHTPHMMHPYDERFIYMADLVPMSNHIHIPWVMGYDIAAGQTTIDKREFYQFIVEKNLTMIFEHDPLFWGATLVNEKGKFKAKDKFSATDELVIKI